MDDPKLPKPHVAHLLLNRGSIFVHFDPRAVERLPPYLRKLTNTVLNVGLNMPIPIPDLAVDDIGIRGTLSFNSGPCFCDVPWEAVFALMGDDDRGMVWPESIPEAVREDVRAKEARAKFRVAK